ncbi:MAG TPA: substrate-binding domain-containing protein [Burkholderiales bacterium]
MKTALGIMALVIPLFVGAAEINGLSTIAVQSAMEELIPHFEKASGHKVHVAFGLGVAMAKRVQDGEAADFVLGPRSAIDGLAKAGKLAPGSDAALARSSVAVAVRKGAPKPDISTPDALKRALLAAKAISYSNPAYGGASGVHFAKVLERLGIVDEMKAKTKFPPEGGFTARLLAAGEVDLAIQQTGELISVPGVELAGSLPGELQSITTFAIAIPTAARQPDAAKALIKYLQSAEAAAVMKARGLDPAAQVQ